MSASLIGLRMVTIVLAVFGLLMVALGLSARKDKRESNNWAWFLLGGTMNGLVVFLALFVPGLLNAFWAQS